MKPKKKMEMQLHFFEKKRYIHIFIYVCVKRIAIVYPENTFSCICVNIYRERERKKERTSVSLCFQM